MIFGRMGVSRVGNTDSGGQDADYRSGFPPTDRERLTTRRGSFGGGARKVYPPPGYQLALYHLELGLLPRNTPRPGAL
jgi:hypothetical protein